MKPDYPIYIIPKGRSDCCLTAQCFIKDRISFKLVIEPQEEELYKKLYKDYLVVLPFSNLGMGGTPARNWCWQDAKASGFKRHWIFDDNISYFGRLHKGMRIPCNAAIAIKVVEDFTDRYENIAVAGFNYRQFTLNDKKTPFTLNCHVYSAMLILNDIPYKWRLKYNEDTDLCLQILTGGEYCTILFHAFYANKMTTMTMKGGNTAELYKGDGRLKMARSLEAVWPQHVSVKWRYGRPQHVVKNNWRNFTTPLVRRTDIDFSKLANKYTMKLTKVKSIKSQRLKKIYNEGTMNG